MVLLFTYSSQVVQGERKAQRKQGSRRTQQCDSLFHLSYLFLLFLSYISISLTTANAFFSPFWVEDYFKNNCFITQSLFLSSDCMIFIFAFNSLGKKKPKGNGNY